MAQMNPEKSVLVITDLEPDDLAALAFLGRCPVKVTGVVFERGTQDSFFPRCKLAYRALFPSGPLKVAHSNGSNVMSFTYPPVLEGGDFFNCQVATPNELIFQQPPPDIVLALGPMTAMMKEWTTNPECMDMFKNTDLIVSGSFNFRSLLYLGVTGEQLTQFLGLFRATYIFETFHAFGAGVDNTLSPSNTPEGFMFRMKASGLFNEEFATAWDTYNLDDCIETCQQIVGRDPKTSCPLDWPDFGGNAEKFLAPDSPLERAAQFQRNYKAAMQIEKHLGQQMVVSDLATVVCAYDSPDEISVPAKIEFDKNRYLNWKPCEDSNIRIFTGALRDRIIGELESRMRDTFSLK